MQQLSTQHIQPGNAVVRRILNSRQLPPSPFIDTYIPPQLVLLCDHPFLIDLFPQSCYQKFHHLDDPVKVRPLLRPQAPTALCKIRPLIWTPPLKCWPEVQCDLPPAITNGRWLMRTLMHSARSRLETHRASTSASGRSNHV